MKARNPKVAFDLYKWLPSYGETKIELSARELQLEVTVFYDTEEFGQMSMKIIFRGVAAFLISTIPGVELTKCHYEGGNASGALIEFEDSEAAQMWQSCLPWRDTVIRHYQVFFLAENKRLEVFAQECGLNAPQKAPIQ